MALAHRMDAKSLLLVGSLWWERVPKIQPQVPKIQPQVVVVRSASKAYRNYHVIACARNESDTRITSLSLVARKPGIESVVRENNVWTCAAGLLSLCRWAKKGAEVSSSEQQRSDWRCSSPVGAVGALFVAYWITHLSWDEEAFRGAAESL